MFGSLGFTELILILFIVLIIFGAGKLPQLGEGIGKAIKGFKKSVHEADAIEAEAQAQAQAQQAEPVQAQAIQAPPPVAMSTPVVEQPVAAALTADPALAGYEGRVSDSGEGRWTVQAEIDEAVPAPVLSAAL